MSKASRQTQRAVSSMTLGVLQGYVKRRESDWTDAMDEYDAQFQIPISATVGDRAAWATVQVEFPTTFVVDAPAKTRDNGLDRPLFTYGVEGGGMFVCAAVSGWIKDDLGYTGAVVSVGIVNPGVKRKGSYTGLLHMNFQGYGAPLYPTNEETDDASEEEA